MPFSDDHPGICTLQVRPDSFAVVIANCDIEIGLRQALLPCFSVPAKSLLLVPRNSAPQRVHDSQAVFRLGISLFRSLPIPLGSQCIILSQALTLFVGPRKLELGFGVPSLSFFCQVTIRDGRT